MTEAKEYLSFNDARINSGIIEWEAGLRECTNEENQLWATLKRIFNERDDLILKTKEYEGLSQTEIELIQDMIGITLDLLTSPEVSRMSPLPRRGSANSTTRHELRTLLHKIQNKGE